MKKFYLLSLFAGIALVFSACVEKLDFGKLDKDVEYNASLVIPVARSEVSIYDIFSSNNPDGWGIDGDTIFMIIDTVLHLPVDNNVTTGLGSSFDNEYVFGESFSGVTVTSANVANYNSPAVTRDFDFDFNEGDVQRVDYFAANGASLSIKADLENVTISGNAKIRMIVKFPAIQGLGAETYVTEITGGHTENPIEIPAFAVDFGDNHNNLTAISIQYELVVPAGAANKIEFGANAKIKSEIQMVDIEMDFARGFFNRSNTITSDSIYTNIPTDFFKRDAVTYNRLLFHDPRITFKIVNNIGIPLTFIVDSIMAMDKDGYKQYGDFNGNQYTDVPIARAMVVGDSATTYKRFDRNYGRTDRLFSKANGEPFIPEKIDYGFHVEVNHAEAVANPVHFVKRPAVIDMYVGVRLPMWFDPTSSYFYTDTINADLSDALSMQFGPVKIDFERIKIDLKIENQLPVQAIGTAYFLDENNVVLYTESNINIPCPNVDANGYSTDKKTVNVTIPADLNDQEHLMEYLQNTKKIVFAYEVTAANVNNQINARATDKLKASVSLFVIGKVTSNIDSIFGKNNE
ncbi:MAG: hypothetical protein LBN95_01680 [Prevotellaceae bacterium]|jgi:hypothetical protein|nr:hypothetical protein [Prevotellaceae bacterium]